MSSSEDEIMEIVNVPSSSDNDLSILSKTTSNITKPDILKKIRSSDKYSHIAKRPRI